MKPKVGQVVHYREDGYVTCNPAIITKVIPSDKAIDLEVVALFTLNGNDSEYNWFTAEHSEEKPFTNTWHTIDGCPFDL